MRTKHDLKWLNTGLLNPGMQTLSFFLDRTDLLSYIEVSASPRQPYRSMLFDLVDNDQNGAIDELVNDDGASNRSLQGRLGTRFLREKKIIGRINLNEAENAIAMNAWQRNFGPIGLSFRTRALVGNRFDTIAFTYGQKPVFGYPTTPLVEHTVVSWAGEAYVERRWPRPQYMKYQMYFEPWLSYHRFGAPYWIDASSEQREEYPLSLRSNRRNSGDKGPNGAILNYFIQTEMDVGLDNFSLQSPVYTVFVTAQSLTREDPATGLQRPVAETKIQATLERTYDGKMNVLEFKWLPRQ